MFYLRNLKLNSIERSPPKKKNYNQGKHQLFELQQGKHQKETETHKLEEVKLLVKV